MTGTEPRSSPMEFRLAIDCSARCRTKALTSHDPKLETTSDPQALETFRVLKLLTLGNRLCPVGNKLLHRTPGDLRVVGFQSLDLLVDSRADVDEIIGGAGSD